MIRHIVLLKFRPDVSRETRINMFAELAGLQDLDGVIGFHAGRNVAVETHLVRGNHDGFWFDFESAKARDAYLINERHAKVGAQIVDLTEGGIDGVTVFDIEIPD